MIRKLASAFLLVLATGCAAQSPAPPQTPDFFAFRPTLEREPTPEEMLRVYPTWALARRVSGSATLVCTVVEGGGLSQCVVSRPIPISGFAEAARALAPSYKVAPVLPGVGGLSLGKLVSVRVLFQPPAADIPAPTLSGVGYAARPDAADISRFYPMRALENEEQGLAVLQCKAGPEGRMTDCIVVEEDPLGAGFGMAAIRLVQSTVAVPLQDGAGAPTAGRTARIPIRFLLPQ